MERKVLEDISKVWRSIVRSDTAKQDDGAVQDAYRHYFHMFGVGESYCFIFNLATVEIESVSESVETALGLRPDLFTIRYILENIHPDDMPTFLRFQKRASDFFSDLPPDKKTAYKTRHDYRLRKADGSYARILHQAVVIQPDDNNGVLRIFCMCSDISHLKTDTVMKLSFISLDGGASFLNVDSGTLPKPTFNPLTARETEVFLLLMENCKTREIAERLNLSEHTVNTHRKNIFRKLKADGMDSLDLIRKGIQDGWL